ncbi:hypothetical protein [Methylobacterium sp. E-066]|uniref:hypothetical protein n=1 Tax=Methylobacterium sp. E-066 TaxID=2836584 RepID=UPI001FB96313|nr:hypothetical protein [Methylobacterium sp. E-066]MCJ2142410.1 hypothetical protein [Methylobacterium sp. E-066]
MSRPIGFFNSKTQPRNSTRARMSDRSDHFVEIEDMFKKFVRKPGTALLVALLVTALPRAVYAQEVELDAEPNRVNAAQPVAIPDPQAMAPTRQRRAARVEPATVSNPAAIPLAADGAWTFGGAVRGRITLNFDDINRRTSLNDTGTYFGVDALILKANYDSNTFFGAAQYNIYGGAFPFNRAAGYKETFGEANFLKFAYAGIKLDNENSVTIGLQQVPFGIVPYFSTSFIETFAYVIGIEEMYNVGVKFSHVERDFNYQLGYFPRMAAIISA